MRVALIAPRLFNNVYHFFPIGLGYIAGALEKCGIEYGWYDQRLENWSTAELIGKIKQAPAYDCFGITGLLSSFLYVREICTALRENFPGTPIVLGGKQSSTPAGIIFKEMNPDFIIHGEGEEAFIMLLEMFSGQRFISSDSVGARVGPQDIPGLIYRDDAGEIHQNSYALVKNINDYTIPFKNVPMGRYISHDVVQSNGLKTVTIISSRGCPFECGFCNFSDGISGKPVRSYHAEQIEKELCYFKEKFGLQHVFYCDDVFALNTKRLEEMGAMHKRLGIRYSTTMRLDMVTEERIRLLEDSGCIIFQVGVESASPKILKCIDKKLDLERYQKNIELLQKSKLVVSFNFITGYIGETEETLEETYQFCLRNRILYTSFFVTAYPQTKLYQMVKERFEIGDETEYMLKLSQTDLQTNYVLNISDMAEVDLRRKRDEMIVGTALNCFTRNKILQFMLRPFFKFYWNVIKANDNKLAWLRHATDMINWVIIKPLFRLSRQLNFRRWGHPDVSTG